MDSNDDKLYQLEQLQKENAQLKEKLRRIEEEKKVAEYLPAHRSRFMRVFRIISYSTDLHSFPLYLEGAVKEITGYEISDFLSSVIKREELIHPEDLPVFQAARHKLIDSRDDPQIMEYRIISGDGQIFWVNDMAAVIYDDSHQAIGIEGLLIDSTRRKEAEEEYLERQAHLDSILNSVQDVIWSVAPDTFELTYISPSAEKAYGYPLQTIYEDAANGHQVLHTSRELLLENFAFLLQRGWFDTEFCLSLPNGEKRWFHRRAYFAHDSHGVVSRIDGIDTDITRRKQAEDTLKYISMHDCLTDLFNRFFFEEEMQRLDNEAFESAGLIICDIDGLKIVNDNLGHAAGDKLLAQCARTLKNFFNKDELVSRIGGDEFAILLKNCSAQELSITVDSLRQAIADSNKCSELPFPLSLSIGMASKSSPEIKMSEVFRQADNLMYAEKPLNHQHFLQFFQETP